MTNPLSKIETSIYKHEYCNVVVYAIREGEKRLTQ